MRLFTFITYLTNHIPEKHFKVIRSYGLFSNRLKCKLLPITRKVLNQKQSTKSIHIKWKEPS
ncbi:MAG: transposase [Bacteroidetes bacterium]|nr:transposase [Bacteroidota bacterium]